MVDVPTARRYGFRLDLNEDVMREVLNSGEVKAALHEVGETVREGVVSHIQATATPEDATNYVSSMFFEDSFSDDYGFDFDAPFALGNRPVVVVGVPPGRGANPAAKPPMLLESQHHALTAVPGVTVGGRSEDVR